MQINAVAEITVFPVSPCIPKDTFATNYVFINLVEDKQTRVMHVTDWRYEKGKLFQAINLFSLNTMLAAREVMRPKFRVSHFR